ncbi:MAG: hypothetical protein RR277_00960 [Rikenellaceae bacterium]
MDLEYNDSMEFIERKHTTEMLLDAASLQADVYLLEKVNGRSRVLARKSRLFNLQFEVIWELLSFVSTMEIKDNRIAYNASKLACDTNVITTTPPIIKDVPKKNILPKRKSTLQSNGKK